MFDPRIFQIAALASLLGWGVIALDFDVRVEQAFVLVGVALWTQWIFSRASGRAVDLPVDLRSPLISSLSLCLLLRTDALWVAGAVAATTIASKFLIRSRGKHVFNPTTFGLATALIVSDRAWVSAGQWGTTAWAAFAMVCAGVLVVRRAERSDVTWAFLASYLALVFGRSLWLGDPFAVPMHALQSGALLLFAFFMISDPRTTPDSRAGRILFAAAVAGGAFFVQYGLYRSNGLIWSLAACAPLVPLLDRLLPGPAHRWPAGSSNDSPRKEVIPDDDESWRPVCRPVGASG